MDEAVAVLRIALGVIFATSAAAKLAQWRELPASTAALGMPGSAAPVVSRAAVVAEVAVAGLLVAATTAVLGAVIGTLLLTAFTGLLLWNLVRGHRPPCNCFGRLAPRPISWWSVARNGSLLAGCTVVVVSGGGAPLPALVEGGDATTAAVVAGLVALSLVVLVQARVLAQLVRQHGRVLLRLDELERQGPPADAPAPVVAAATGLAVGTEAPDFALPGLHGETMTLAALRAAGKPVLLVFSDAGCGPCNALVPSIVDWQRRHAERLRVVVIASGDSASNRAKAAEHGLVDLFLQDGTEVAEAYQYAGTPGAVLVDVAGRIAAPLVSGGPAIESLVDRVVGTVPVELGRRHEHPHDHHHDHQADAPKPVGLSVGEVAPSFRLPTVGGGEAALEEFTGRAALVLFWNPRCGFCESLRDELLEWESTRSPDDPELLVVSTGDEAANADEGFASTVLLDATSSTMSAYRAEGTPMAVLVDEGGLIASATGVGATGIRQFLYSARKESA